MNRDNAAREMFLIAHEALAHYDVGNARPEFIGHGSSISFRIETRGGMRKFLLRLHRPTSAGGSGLRQRRAHFESELEWLAALESETDLAVQRPLRNRFGQFVTELDTLHGTFHATILCWVDGGPIGPVEYTAEAARALGGVIATLHAHSGEWSLPNTFTRPRYDSERMLSSLDSLAPLVRDGDADASAFAVLHEAGELVADRLAEIEETTSPWPLIHANISPENVAFQSGEPHLTDFRGCGFGHPGFDVGRVLHWLPEDKRAPLLDGYRAVLLLEVDSGALETLALAALIESLPNECVYGTEVVGRRITALAKEEARTYLDGEPFLRL